MPTLPSVTRSVNGVQHAWHAYAVLPMHAQLMNVAMGIGKVHAAAVMGDHCVAPALAFCM